MKAFFSVFLQSSPSLVYKSFIHNNKVIALLLSCILIVAGCNTGNSHTDQEKGSNEQTKKATATAIMEAASGSKVSGKATFTKEDGAVRFQLSVQNVTPGVHAVHLHEKGDCSAEDASSAGGHWNPAMKPHGQRGAGGAYHKGDVGNMDVGDNGNGTLSLVVEGWTIGGADSTNIVGKSVIVHDKADDFSSQPSGNAGSRISCGLIKQD